MHAEDASAGILKTAPQARALHAWLAPACAWLVNFCFYYPGSLGTDSITQWHEARFNDFFSQHPPFMGFIWRWLDMIVPGPALFLALELLVFWAAVAVLLLRLKLPARWCVLACVLLSTYPFLMAHAALIYKDILGGDLGLLGFALLLGYPDARRPVRLLVGAFAFFAVAGLVRYQLWSMILPAACAVLWADCQRPGRRDWATAARRAAIALSTVFAVVGIGEGAMDATLNLRNSDTVSESLRKIEIFDIAGIVAHDPSVSLDPVAALGLDPAAVRSGLLSRYSPYRSDPTWGPEGPFGRLTRAQRPDLRAVWRTMVLENLRPFVIHRLDAFARVMGIGNIVECSPLSVKAFSTGRPEFWNDLHGERLKEPYATAVLWSRYFPENSSVFRPITYFLLSISLLFFLAPRRRPADVVSGAMIAAAWIYWLTFLTAPQACDVRYSYFPCAAILLVLLIVAGSRLRAAD